MPPWEKYQGDGSADSANGPWAKYAPKEKSDTQSLDLADVPGRALENLGPSAKRFGESMVQPFIHPIETAKNIGKVSLGYASKIAPGSLTNQRFGPYADAVNKFFVDRYGGWENIKHTMAEDPVGFAADIATVATGGEAALARLPGAVGKVGEVSGQVAKYTNPLNVGKVLPQAGKLASEIGGVVTGKGGETFRGLAREGYKGGRGEVVARQNLRAPEQYAPDIVKKARSALAEMYLERSADYQKFAAQFGQQSKPLSFNEIDAAVGKVQGMGRFRGLDVSRLAGEKALTDAQEMITGIQKNINEWKALPPQFFHTGPGLDALKQHIGSKIDWKTRPDAANKAAQEIYNAIRDTIAKQDPAYAAAMKDYSQATDLLQNVEKTLSLGKKASEDTALRKLLSTTRSDVNTNFGRRKSLAEELNKRDPSIMPALYGQSAAPLAPGGLARGAAGGVGLYELAQHGALNPKIIAALLSTSPRLWGEAALAAGKGARKAKDLTPQQILDLYKKLPPNVLQQLGLGSRAVGGNPAQ